MSPIEPRFMQFYSWAGCALLALSLTACGSNSDGAVANAAPADREATPAEPEEDPIAVRTTALSRQTMAELYSTTATLRAEKQATVTARTAGVVEQLLVEEGDRVEAGAPLAILENDEQQIAFSRASMSAETFRSEFDRSNALHEQGLVSDEEFETARRDSIEAQHAADLAQLQLSRTTIVAPFAGQILLRHLDVGATVASGTAVYDLADLDPLYADINIPERHIDRLAIHQTVRLAADAFDLAVGAQIERIAPRVDTETGTVKVTLAVGGQTGLRPGTFVRAAVVTATHVDSLVVPRSALVAEGRRWHLFRLTAEGTHVERIEVTRGLEEGAHVEVANIDSEQLLVSGDEVVTVGASALSDGAHVDAGMPEVAESTEAARDDT